MSTVAETSSEQTTTENYQQYEKVDVGQSPVSVKDMRAYLGGVSSSCDDILESLIASCTAYAELYTGKELTDNGYELLIDCFEDRISLKRHPIDMVDSVKYYSNGSLTTVDPSTYYLKHGRYLSEILLVDGMMWPTDVDVREQAVKIEFTTRAISDDQLAIAVNGIKRHVAFMFENRGDCSDCEGCAGKDMSGANHVYDMITMPRI